MPFCTWMLISVWEKCNLPESKRITGSASKPHVSNFAQNGRGHEQGARLKRAGIWCAFAKYSSHPFLLQAARLEYVITSYGALGRSFTTISPIIDTNQ